MLAGLMPIYVQLQWKTSAFWRCQYCDGRQEQQQQRSGVGWSLEDKLGVLQRAELENDPSLSRSPGDYELSPDNWTLSYLYSWSLVLLGSDSERDLVLPS